MFICINIGDLCQMSNYKRMQIVPCRNAIMMYKCFVVIICCLWWSCVTGIQDKRTRHWLTHVILKNVTAPHEDASWTMEMKTSDNLDSGLSKLASQDKRKDLGYYKFYSTPATWFGAQQICEQEGSHLLVLNSEREFKTIKGVWDTYPKLFSDSTNEFIHIGLHDLLQEGRYVTLDGQIIQETGYTKWAAKEPSHGVTANCLRVSRDGLYYDSYCNNLFAFFCEI